MEIKLCGKNKNIFINLKIKELILIIKNFN